MDRESMADEALERESYSLLKDLRVEIEGKEETFSLCFWLYLLNSTTLPVTIIQKVDPDVTSNNSPFLAINTTKVMLFPLLPLQKEDPDFEVPHASVEMDIPREKWVHFGCEVSTDFVRLHIDGEIVGEKPLSSVLETGSGLSGFGKITLVSGAGADSRDRGYIYSLKTLPKTLSIKDHYAKDPPVQLSIDKSSASEIEESEGGVWSIVGGKASCRRNFSLDVVFTDGSGQPVREELEVVASLVYLEMGMTVERTSDGEAPLLISYDGIEFASSDRPTKLLHGRASFKLKISQLSSKCQNKLFRIKFHLPTMETYPFFVAFSPPIRSISRNRNTRISSVNWKRPTSALHPISHSSELDEDMLEVQQDSLHETKPNPSSKRLRLGQDKISTNFKADRALEPLDEECNSHAWTENKVDKEFMKSLTMGPENSEEDNSSTDSESIEARNSAPKGTSSSRNQISDLTVFKYSLANISERSLLLKEIANSASNEEILDFAHQVSLYSGCSHHRNQIVMAKRLVEEGTKAWNSISQNNNTVQWESMVFEIEEQFMKISRCSSRSLTQQDFELLRRIASCQEYVAQENFEQMWCWLYPVAYTLSREWINAMWSSTSPRWIEGFITKEEAEHALRGPRGLQEPGTFILRFPTSRSWPHPDAGSLVVTYVGSDYTLHHKLLSLDHAYSSLENQKDAKPLQDMLLEEPELSRLGRIIRSH